MLNCCTGFSHDWSMCDGVLRVSGEDHYSALDPPRSQSRVRSLARWAHSKYTYFQGRKDFAEEIARGEVDVKKAAAENEYGIYGGLHGVYSETPDCLPLVGKLHSDSAICYLLGCNAWGQVPLSFGATLIPGLLGYASHTQQEAELARFLSPVRASLLRFADGRWKNADINEH
jgi:hypothetical protein